MKTPQPSLFDALNTPDAIPVHVRNSQTSREAAEAILPHLNHLQARVLAYIALHGPCTDEIIQDGTGLSGNTVRPRRGELAEKGLILPDPEKGLTKSNRRAERWTLTAKGREAWDRGTAAMEVAA